MKILLLIPFWILIVSVQEKPKDTIDEKLDYSKIKIETLVIELNKEQVESSKKEVEFEELKIAIDTLPKLKKQKPPINK